MVYFAMAEKLGCTVGELKRRMSSRELTEWLAFYKIRDVQDRQRVDADKLSADVKRKARRNK